MHPRSTLHGSLLPPLYSHFTPIHPCLLLSVILTCKAKPQTTKHISSDIPPSEIPPWILFFIPLPRSSDLQQPALPPQPGQPSLGSTALTSKRSSTVRTMCPILPAATQPHLPLSQCSCCGRRYLWISAYVGVPLQVPSYLPIQMHTQSPEGFLRHI